MHISPSDIQAYLSVRSLDELRLLFESGEHEDDPLQECMIGLQGEFHDEEYDQTTKFFYVPIRINLSSQAKLTAALSKLGIDNEYEENLTKLSRRDAYFIAQKYLETSPFNDDVELGNTLKYEEISHFRPTLRHCSNETLRNSWFVRFFPKNRMPVIDGGTTVLVVDQESGNVLGVGHSS